MTSADHMNSDEMSYSNDLSRLFTLMFDNFKQIFEDLCSTVSKESDSEAPDHQLLTQSVKSFSELIMFASNDVLNMKNINLHQEISKNQIMTMVKILLDTIYILPGIVSKYFGKIMMSNTMLFASPLGQAYFSVTGDSNLMKNDKEVAKSTIAVIKFYKIKGHTDVKGKKKDKEMLNMYAQFWSLFILQIVNEYSINRANAEDNTELKETLLEAEKIQIPPSKLENYVRCCKIMTNVVEYFKSFANPKAREQEVIVFAASFIKICGTPQSKIYFECVMCLLRLKKLFNKIQIKKITTFMRRMYDDIQEDNIKLILRVLIDELESIKDDTFGVFSKDEDSKSKDKIEANVPQNDAIMDDDNIEVKQEVDQNENNSKESVIITQKQSKKSRKIKNNNLDLSEDMEQKLKMK